MLRTRVLSAAVLIPLVAGLTYAGGWVLSGAFSMNGDGRQYIYATLFARDPTPQCYEVAAELLEGGENGEPRTEFPLPPFLGFLEPSSRLYFGPASHVPPAPIRAEFLRVVSA